MSAREGIVLLIVERNDKDVAKSHSQSCELRARMVLMSSESVESPGDRGIATLSVKDLLWNK